MEIMIRAARPEEAAPLSALALRSKGYWGYDADLLESFRSELTLTPSDIPARRTVVAELTGALVGVATVEGTAPTGELGMLFVAPEAIGKGIGTTLLRHALRTGRQAGFERLTVTSDPNAEPFYRAMGARRVGSLSSRSITGRELPLLEIDTL